MTVLVPPFVVEACQKFPPSFLSKISVKPPVAEWKEDIQKSLCLVRPVLDAWLIRAWASLFGADDKGGMAHKSV